MAAYSGGYLKSLPQQSYDQKYKKFLYRTTRPKSVRQAKLMRNLILPLLSMVYINCKNGK